MVLEIVDAAANDAPVIAPLLSAGIAVPGGPSRFDVM
jgi:hypothetical protein